MTIKLDHITTIDFARRTNLKGERIGANWVFLLSQLDLRRVVCIGAPSKEMLPTLQLISDELVCTRSVSGEDVTVQSLEQIHESSVDLVYVIDKGRVARADLQRILKPNGLLYYEYHGQDRTGYAPQESMVTRFWLTPTLGNVQTAVPVAHERGREFILHRELFTSTIRHQTLEPIGRRLVGRNTQALMSQDEDANQQQASSGSLKRALFASLRRARSSLIQSATQIEQTLIRTPLTSRWTRRNGALVQMGSKAAGGVPDYLQSCARGYGIDISQWEWAFVARVDYPSQKLLFYLFEPDRKEPSILIKMVREPQYNERLEREYQGLKHIRDAGFVQSHTIPNVLFQGYHHGLFFIAENVLDGRPFAQKTSFDSNCQYGRFVIQWMIDVGIATRTNSTGTEIATLLQPIYKRFVEVYNPTVPQKQFLQEQLHYLSRAVSIPLVARHGDPGLQNLLILQDDTVVFLDWENAELAGLSLWDVFYFLAAYCIKAGQVKSHLSSLDAYERYFLHESEMQTLIVESVHRYCERLSLDPRLIVPLYYLFWMFRALKQSTMLNPTQIQKSLTWQILQLSINQHNSSTLQLLTSNKPDNID